MDQLMNFDRINGHNPGGMPSSSSNAHTSQNISRVAPSMYANGSNMLPQQSHMQTQLTQGMAPQAQWNSLNNSNGSPQVPPPQLDQAAWQNQLLPQLLAQNLGGLAMPFLQQQLLHDAYMMSAPVKTADEAILVQALLASRKKGETYKDALNGLHGKNGHSANLWKDYYLDHKHRLDESIAIHLASSTTVRAKTTKKPSPTMFKVEPSPGPSLPFFPPKRGPVKRVKKETPPKALQTLGGRRNTINSLTAPAAVFGDHLPPPNVDVKIPKPPSRSPSPPTVVIPMGRGNRYTPEDREYFHKFIAWRLKHNPTLSRNDLCNLLAEKASHHTAASWASYWSNHHDIPDKIFAAARGGSVLEISSDTNSEASEIVARKPNYVESSSEDGEGDSDSEDVQNISGDEIDDDDDDSSSASIISWDVSHMGRKGEPFTDADLYFTAKHIASIPDFDQCSGKQKWSSHAEKFPQRSAKAWAEYHRRNEGVIGKIARKIRAQEQAQPRRLSFTIQAQVGRRTRATPPSSATTSPSKRKFEFRDERDATTSLSKRSKVNL